VATPGTAVRIADSWKWRWRPSASRIAGLTRVLGHDRAEQRVADLDLVGGEAVALELARPQIAARDRHLLARGVAVEADHLHPVQQRAWDRVGEVGGGDEHHVAQVELHVEVVIAEAVVLRRVEHLEQG
jgi:hypothetical protein